jgi:hypothetical protein
MIEPGHRAIVVWTEPPTAISGLRRCVWSRPFHPGCGRRPRPEGPQLGPDKVGIAAVKAIGLPMRRCAGKSIHSPEAFEASEAARRA